MDLDIEPTVNEYEYELIISKMYGSRSKKIFINIDVS